MEQDKAKPTISLTKTFASAGSDGLKGPQPTDQPAIGFGNGFAAGVTMDGGVTINIDLSKPTEAVKNFSEKFLKQKRELRDSKMNSNSKRSTIRVRVLGVILGMVITLLIEVFHPINWAGLQFFQFIVFSIFIVILYKQKCEVCGLKWFEKNFPIEEVKTKFFDNSGRDFYPNPLEIEKKCPKCGIERI